ncbi:MAG: nucleoside monophosphate kinase [Candidatus Paceibacterota bacterium]
MKAIIVMGPQGSGKGTQAELLAKKLDLFHFDSGQYLRAVLYDPASKNDKVIQRERKLNEAGILNTPSWILKIFSQIVKKTAALKKGIVLSGSPRTIYEAFGYNQGENKKNKTGLMDVLSKSYGKENVFTFVLDIPLKESLKRTSGRLTCSVCKSPFMVQKYKMDSCPFCGGELVRRKDDNKEGIMKRLEEYKNRTTPILTELRKRKYKIIKIDGTPLPYKIHKAIIGKVK